MLLIGVMCVTSIRWARCNLVIFNISQLWKGDVIVKKQVFGRAIGSHLGKPIYESFMEQNTRYVFDRLAKCDDEGCPLFQVKEGEVLLEPGLIYKRA